jgi:chromosome segregation ATPase
MMRRTYQSSAQKTLLAFSTVTLLATVGACGRTAGSNEQQLLDLAAKASTRLKAQNGGVADSLTKRNAEATERLLRGLIDKEREERMAADKLLSDRIDALELELRAFKDQVNARFAEVDKRDAALRGEMTNNFEELRKVDKELAAKIEAEAKARIAEFEKVRGEQAELENKVTKKFDAVEKSFQQKLDEQKRVFDGAISSVKSDLQAKEAELTRKISESEAAQRDALQKEKDALTARIALVEQAAAAEKARLDKTVADLDATRKSLESKISGVKRDLDKAKVDLKEQMATASTAQRLALEANVKLLEGKMADMNDELRRENTALAAKQAESDRKITSVSSRLEAEVKARQEAISALKGETEALIKKTDSKTQSELRSLIAQVEQASASNVEMVQKELMDKLAKQDADTRVAMLGLTNRIAKVASEGRKSREDLEKRMLSSVENVRGEMISKVADLNSALSSARAEMSEKISSGLSGLSAEFSEKLKTAEKQLSENLRKEVASQRLEMEALKLGLSAAEKKFEDQMKAQSDKLKSDMDAMKTSIDASMQDMFNKHQAEALRNQETAAALSKMIAEQQSAMLASEASYNTQLKTLQDQQAAANAAQDAAAAAERKALLDALQAEREARAAELLKLGTDMVTLKSAQDQARAKLEADMKAKVADLAGKTDDEKKALEAQIAQLNGALNKLDENTFATVKNLKDALTEERKKTEEQIGAAVAKIETQLEKAALETQKVAARVEAVNRAQEEFQAFVAKNYATKGELEALNLRVEGLEFVTKVMNADMTRANAEMKALISKEVADAKDALSKRIGAVEASVDGIKNKLGSAITDYQSQIASLSAKMSTEIAGVKTDMKKQDDALYAALSDQKSLQDKVNADIMMSVKRQAANFEAMSQNVKKELSDKLVQLEGSIDKTNAAVKAEHEAVQAKFAEVVKQEQALKDRMAKELASLKDEIKDVAKVANQALKLGEANAEEIKLVKADLKRQEVSINGVRAQLNAHEEHVAKKFKLQGDQITKLNDSVDKMKEDFNKRIAEVAAQAEEMVENLGDEVRANFKKVATDMAKLRTAQKSLEAKLTNHYVDTFKLEWDSDLEEFAQLVAEDQSLIMTKRELRNGKSVVVGKGPLVSTLETFGEVRRAFLAALQPRQRADGGERVEPYDRSFVPIMTQCGGNAEATFANAFGRDSFDFLADEYIAGLISGSRGSAADALYLKNGKLSDGDSLHHYILLEALRNLEGGSDDPKCMSQIKSWANEVLNSNEFRAHRERIASNTQFQARVAEFVKAVGDLKTSADRLEQRVANRIVRGQKKIAVAMSRVANPVAIFGQTKPEDVAVDLLGKMANTLSESADSTYDAIARQEEFNKMVAVQRQFVQAMKEENREDAAVIAAAERREKAMNDRVASLETKLASFDKTAKDVDALKGKVDNLNASLSKALDVVMSLAIRAGHPDLVAATKEAGQLIGYSPKEIGMVKPKILEIQHFFASPALANGTDTCTGNTIKRGAGVKFWTQGGQCWVNFRGLSWNRWSSAAQTIWFRVFGAAERLQVWSHHCGSNGPASCNATFRYRTGASSVMSGASNVSSTIVGQPNEGVFDVRMPNIMDPYIQRSLSWHGEGIRFTAFGSDGQGSVSTDYTVQLYSPIVLDFMTVGRPQFSGVDSSNVRFDLDGDGRAERTGWMKGYRDVGLLALDLDGNGSIDSGKELFGEATIVNKTGKKAKDGYAALAQYDSNQNGFIDSKDEIYGKLLVWFDRNHDGKTNSDELVSLAQSEVTRIALKHTRLKDAERFENGNEMRTAAKFWGPKQCGSAGCNSYDVYFSTAFMVSQKK